MTASSLPAALRALERVTCIRLDATVTFAHSDKELAQSHTAPPSLSGYA